MKNRNTASGIESGLVEMVPDDVEQAWAFIDSIIAKVQVNREVQVAIINAMALLKPKSRPVRRTKVVAKEKEKTDAESDPGSK